MGSSRQYMDSVGPALHRLYRLLVGDLKTAIAVEISSFAANMSFKHCISFTYEVVTAKKLVALLIQCTHFSSVQLRKFALERKNLARKTNQLLQPSNCMLSDRPVNSSSHWLLLVSPYK
ncbi:hypothetical protein DPMN_099575 [Dreissena polymorpha]|uniref:Uncharacterized protein n=1 Tax=Dreissena polymorpha TaxID=45954 RepID=A0A9D4R7C9_DREPO|nr:hypothetical protein DPMN_099575 [Dreissena polymorpha]